MAEEKPSSMSYKQWTERAIGKGTIDKMPSDWEFFESRIAEMLVNV